MNYKLQNEWALRLLRLESREEELKLNVLILKFIWVPVAALIGASISYLVTAL